MVDIKTSEINIGNIKCGTYSLTVRPNAHLLGLHDIEETSDMR